MSSVSHQGFYFGLGSFEIGPKFFQSESHYFSKGSNIQQEAKKTKLKKLFFF